MTISGTNGATEVHAELEQFEARLDTELAPWCRIIGPRLFIPGLTSASPEDLRVTDFIPPRDMVLHRIRYTIVPASSSTMNWTFTINAINPVSRAADNQWTQFTQEVGRATTAATTKTGGVFTTADRRVQLTAGIPYRLEATVDHPTGGQVCLIPFLDIPALS